MNNAEESSKKIDDCEDDNDARNSKYTPLPENEMDGLGYTSHSDYGYSGWGDRPSGWTGGG